MKTTYVPGKWLAICDCCGFRYYNDQLRKDWKNLMVCSSCFETRHPQDFLRVPVDNPAVPWARPESPDQFTPVNYICLPENSVAIVGVGVAGCMVVGKVSATTIPNRSAVAGIMVAGNGIAGHV